MSTFRDKRALLVNPGNYMMDLDMKKSIMVYELLRKILGKVRKVMKKNKEKFEEK